MKIFLALLRSKTNIVNFALCRLRTVSPSILGAAFHVIHESSFTSARIASGPAAVLDEARLRFFHTPALPLPFRVHLWLFARFCRGQRVARLWVVRLEYASGITSLAQRLDSHDPLRTPCILKSATTAGKHSALCTHVM